MSGNAIIGALTVVLGLDSAQFDTKWKKVQEDVHAVDLTSGLKAGLGQFEKLLDDVAAKAGGFGTSLLAAGLVIAPFAVAIGGVAEAMEKTNQAIEAGASFAKLGKEVGASTDFIQKFNFAAQQSDIDVGLADESLKGLNTTLGLVQSGLAKTQQTKAFAALGFTPEQLRQYHDVGDLFPVLADRIAAVGNASEQAAIAKRLGIEALLPMLQEGANNFNTLAQKAQDLGIVMSASVVKQAEEAKKKLAEIDDVTKANLNITFAEFAGTLLAVKNAFAEAEKAGLSFLANVTGTQSAKNVVEQTQAQLEALKKNAEGRDLGGGVRALSPSQKALFDVLNQRLYDARAKAAEDDKASAARPTGSAARALVPDTAGAAKAGQQKLAGQEAIAAAQKAELAAQIALTGDVAQLATLKLAQVEQERVAANTKLDLEVQDKKLLPAAAAIAKTANDRAAVEKSDLINREKLVAVAKHELQQREATEVYSQQISAVAAQLAKNATERAAIEEAALQEQQDLDAKKLDNELASQVLTGQITEAEANRQKYAQALAQSAQLELKKEQDRIAIVTEAAQQEQQALQLQADLLTSQADLSKSTYARNVAEQAILAIQQQIERSKAQEAVDVAKVGSIERQEAQARLDALPELQASQKALLAGQTRLVDAIGEASKAAGDLGSAFKAHDWARLFDDFQKTVQTVEASFASQGISGGALTLGSVAGSVIGGKAGGAINAGVGGAVLAGGAASLLTGAGFLAGGGALFGGSALSSVLLGAAGFLGPLAPIIGIVAGLATLFTGSKPSNFTASAAFNGTSGAAFGGDKPDQATTNAVTQAANSILTAEQTLTAAGVTLTTTVQNLEIGQRDASKITLSNGQTLNSPVGDTSAAVDAALKAVLQGAQFTDQAEKDLVDSMLAAGKGFDDIVTAMNSYQAAQAALGNIADQILQLTDPEAYDQKGVTAAIAAQRLSFTQAAQAGQITAEQLTAVNAQLDKLQSLQLDQIDAKYAQPAADDAAAAQAQATQAHQLQIDLMDAEGDAIGELAAKRADELAALDPANRAIQEQIYQLQDLKTAQEAAAQAQQQADQAVTDATTQLSQARDTEAAGVQATIQKYQALQDSLNSYLASLTQAANATPDGYAAATAAFSSTANLAQLGNVDALGNLQGVSQAFLTASKAQAGSALDFARDQAKVKIAVTAAADTAARQVSIAQRQLDALNSEVDAVLRVNDSVLGVADAIAALQAAEAAQAVAGQNALSATLQSYLAAEGANIEAPATSAPNATLPTFDPGATTTATPTITNATAVDPTAIDTTTGAGDTSDLLAQLVQTSQATAVSSFVTAQILKNFNGNGMPGTRDGDTVLTEAA